MSAKNTKLSASMTVAHYRALEQAGDRVALGDFIRERFDERYFKPVEDSPSKHGFTLLAVGCLVVETLESFYQGRADTRNASAQMFRDFFARNTPLNVFGGGATGFSRVFAAEFFIRVRLAADGVFYGMALCWTRASAPSTPPDFSVNCEKQYRPMQIKSRWTTPAGKSSRKR